MDNVGQFLQIVSGKWVVYKFTIVKIIDVKNYSLKNCFGL